MAGLLMGLEISPSMVIHVSENCGFKDLPTGDEGWIIVGDCGAKIKADFGKHVFLQGSDLNCKVTVTDVEKEIHQISIRLMNKVTLPENVEEKPKLDVISEYTVFSSQPADDKKKKKKKPKPLKDGPKEFDLGTKQLPDVAVTAKLSEEAKKEFPGVGESEYILQLLVVGEDKQEFWNSIPITILPSLKLAAKEDKSPLIQMEDDAANIYFGIHYFMWICYLCLVVGYAGWVTGFWVQAWAFSLEQAEKTQSFQNDMQNGMGRMSEGFGGMMGGMMGGMFK